MRIPHVRVVLSVALALGAAVVLAWWLRPGPASLPDAQERAAREAAALRASKAARQELRAEMERGVAERGKAPGPLPAEGLRRAREAHRSAPEQLPRPEAPAARLVEPEQPLDPEDTLRTQPVVRVNPGVLERSGAEVEPR